MSGLYRTFKQNYVPYYPDGRGRDTYIAYNNAGFFHNYKKSLSPKNSSTIGLFGGTKTSINNKSISIKVPSFHYYSDGLGRDKYISINSGGLFYDPKPLISYKLADFLRKNESVNCSPRKKLITLSKEEIKYNKILRIKEKNLVKRLYNNEKEKDKLWKKRKEIINCFSTDEINILNNSIEGDKNKTSLRLPKFIGHKIKINLKKLNQHFSPRFKRYIFENDKNEHSNNNSLNKEKNNNNYNQGFNTPRCIPRIYIKKNKCLDIA